MEEQVISFETAKLAKELGFDIPCGKYYGQPPGHDVLLQDARCIVDMNSSTWAYNAPTQEILRLWLHKHYQIHASAFPLTSDLWYYTIRRFYDQDMYDTVVGPPFDPAKASNTYIEAFEKSLFRSLQKVKNNYKRE